MAIHPTAIIGGGAEIDPSVEVGAYAVIDGAVKIAADTRVYHHAYITGFTEIGPRCEVHPYAVVGHLPQDTHYDGSRTFCRIGAGTVIREFATIHRGTQPETTTTIGQNCLLFAYAHVAHNCALGDNVTLINNVALAGHTEVGRGVVMSANALTHQFVRVGEYTMVAGAARLVMDVPPFMTVQLRNAVSSPNLVGLKRNGFSQDEIAEIKQAYRLLYRSGKPVSAAMEELDATVRTDAGRRLLAFMRAPSKRGVAAGPKYYYDHTEEAQTD